MVKLTTVETDCGHEVEFGGAWPVRGDGAPSIIERKDENFLPALLDELREDNPAAIVPSHRPTSGSDGLLRLYQPVHRTFNLALFEAHCTTFGIPRLDQRKIDSSGLVVRRVRTEYDPPGANEKKSAEQKSGDKKSGEKKHGGRKRYDAWCATKNKVAGWVALPDSSSPDHLRDPDPARRPQPRLTGDPVFDRRQFGVGDITAEETTSLFVAPPDAIAATARTLLYGVIPVTSSSRAGPMPKGAEPSASDWNSHLSPLLRSGGERALWLDMTAAQRAATLDRLDLRSNDPFSDDQANFLLAVRQLAQEFSLLRPANPATRDALIALLNQLILTGVDDVGVYAGNYLLSAARFYFDQPAPAATVCRPKTWPAVSTTLAGQIADKLRQMSRETELLTFGSDQGGGRYDDPKARYVLRAFIRVKQSGTCPPKVVWSPYSEEFHIVPWYESGPLPPVPVHLPDPFDPDFLKNAKPGVAFSVPASLANFLNQDPLSYLKGDAKKSGPALSLDWICAFSIPIITICAFIVLSVMLGILNLIFFWLPFVKICIPFPRPK